MPKIITHSKGGKIIFDEQDWLAGLHPQYTNSYSAKQKMGNYLAFARAFNPYRVMGYAMPGFMPTDVTNVSIVDAVLLNGVVNGTSAYAISSGAKMHKITLTTSALVNDTAGTGFPHTISGTTPVGCDIFNYYIGTTLYLFYLYNNSTQGQLGRNNFGTTFIDDYLTNASYLNASAMDKTMPHPRRISAYDGNVYIGDGRNIHSLNGASGANGTWTANAFQLPQGYIVNSISEIDGYLVIFAYYTSGDAGSGNYYEGKAKAFFWNYWDTKATKIIDLNDNYVIGAFQYKGTVGCFTQGRSGDPTTGTRGTKLQLFNGSGFEIVCSYIGNPPVNGGVDVQGDIIYWAGSDTSAISVWSYGSPFKELPKVFNRLAEGSGNTAGMLKTFAGVTQLLSSGTTTSGGLQTVSTNYYFQSGIATTFAEPNFPVDFYGRIERVTVRFGNTATGGRNFKLIVQDRAGTSKTLLGDGDNYTEVTATTMIKKFYTNLLFEALKLNLTWGSGSAATDAPAVSSVEIDYINIKY